MPIVKVVPINGKWTEVYAFRSQPDPHNVLNNRYRLVLADKVLLFGEPIPQRRDDTPSAAPSIVHPRAAELLTHGRELTLANLSAVDYPDQNLALLTLSYSSLVGDRHMESEGPAHVPFLGEEPLTAPDRAIVKAVPPDVLVAARRLPDTWRKRDLKQAAERIAAHQQRATWLQHHGTEAERNAHPPLHAAIERGQLAQPETPDEQAFHQLWLDWSEKTCLRAHVRKDAPDAELLRHNRQLAPEAKRVKARERETRIGNAYNLAKDEGDPSDTNIMVKRITKHLANSLGSPLPRGYSVKRVTRFVQEMRRKESQPKT